MGRRITYIRKKTTVFFYLSHSIFRANASMLETVKK